MTTREEMIAMERGRLRGVAEERCRVVAVVNLALAFDVPGFILRGIESGVSGAVLAARLRLSDRNTVAQGEPTYGPDKELDPKIVD